MGMRSPDRATRILMSALLRSDLTTSELRELSFAFQMDSDYARRLGRLIDGVLEALEDRSSPKASPGPRPAQELPRSSFLDEALSIVRRRRLPKKALANAVRRIAPQIGPPERLARMTAHSLLSDFFNQASDREATMFMQLLSGEGEIPMDAYLRGILKGR